MIIIFSDLRSVEAVGTNIPFQQIIVRIISDQNTSILTPKIRINFNIKTKLMMPSLNTASKLVRTIYELQNSPRLKKFVSEV